MYFEITNTNVRLGGTQHWVPHGKPLPAWIDSAYSWSSALYMEHNEKDLLPVHRCLPAEQGSEQRFTPYLWARINAAWPANLGTLKSQKPWVIAVSLALSGVPLDPGVEPKLTSRALAELRAIQYLETVADFVGCADSIDDSVCAEGIAWLLSNPGSPRRLIDDLYAAWIAGDADTVAKQTQATGLLQFPQARKALVDSRNAMWLPRILGLLPTSTPTLVLVGAGHLGGPAGLLALLKQAGCATHLIP